jgi:hypothetical protein
MRTPDMHWGQLTDVDVVVAALRPEAREVQPRPTTSAVEIPPYVGVVCVVFVASSGDAERAAGACASKRKCQAISQSYLGRAV